ncbi:hypothetical protein FO519_010929, partial [Halicephalobus sp. NKZ332]
RELINNEELRSEDWSRFLPQFKKKIQPAKVTRQAKKKRKEKWNKKSEYTPFPPEQTLSKIDRQLESGEYFMNEKLKKKENRKKVEMDQIERTTKKQEEKKSVFIPPEEKPRLKRTMPADSKISVDLEGLKKKVKNR